ncbi:hypothetical protein I79_004568 [Cricetulus griseus]|uniref:Uncharacterized protein n=1 Tax=Cricetulus griseus TaxID=10029 RepID=G3H2W5_CRIGR|nr:hypothetical protein I79_004568 [Cricetulus griseus]
MRLWSLSSASSLCASQSLSNSVLGKEMPDTLCSVSGAAEDLHKAEEFCEGAEARKMKSTGGTGLSVRPLGCSWFRGTLTTSRMASSSVASPGSYLLCILVRCNITQPTFSLHSHCPTNTLMFSSTS